MIVLPTLCATFWKFPSCTRESLKSDIKSKVLKISFFVIRPLFKSTKKEMLTTPCFLESCF